MTDNNDQQKAKEEIKQCYDLAQKTNCKNIDDAEKQFEDLKKSLDSDKYNQIKTDPHYIFYHFLCCVRLCTLNNERDDLSNIFTEINHDTDTLLRNFYPQIDYLNFGEELEKLGKEEESMIAYLLHFRSKPFSYKAYNRIALLHINARRYQLAVKYLLEACEIHFKNITLKTMLAFVLYEANTSIIFEKSTKDFYDKKFSRILEELTLFKNPTDYERKEIGMLYVHIGNIKDGIEILENVNLFLNKEIEQPQILWDQELYVEVCKVLAFAYFKSKENQNAKVNIEKGLKVLGQIDDQAKEQYIKNTELSLMYLKGQVLFLEKNKNYQLIIDLYTNIYNKAVDYSFYEELKEMLKWNLLIVQIDQSIKENDSKKLLKYFEDVRDIVTSELFHFNNNSRMTLSILIEKTMLTADKTHLSILFSFFKTINVKLKSTIIEAFTPIIEQFNIDQANQLRKLLNCRFTILKRLKYDHKKEIFAHYSNVNNLQNLIKPNAKLRLSNADFLNDPNEGGVLHEMGNTKAEEHFYKKESYNLIAQFAKGLFEQSDTLNPSYILSFTKAIDDLSMWSMYGDDGKGCCLEIDLNSLKESYVFEHHSYNKVSDNTKSFQKLGSLINKYLFNEIIIDESETFNLYNVVYVDKGKPIEQEYGDVFLKLDYIFETVLNSYSDDHEKNKYLLKYLSFILNDIKFLFKKKSYQNEKEIRILKNVYNKEDIILDESDSLSVPKFYVELMNIAPLKYNKIILGPKIEKRHEIIPYLKYCMVHFKNIAKYSDSVIEYR